MCVDTGGSFLRPRQREPSRYSNQGPGSNGRVRLPSRYAFSSEAKCLGVYHGKWPRTFEFFRMGFRTFRGVFVLKGISKYPGPANQ